MSDVPCGIGCSAGFIRNSLKWTKLLKPNFLLTRPGITPAHIDAVLAGTELPNPALLAALGLERIGRTATYRAIDGPDEEFPHDAPTHS